MLNKQYNLYSVDTGNFYSNHEKYLHDMNCKYRRERNYVKNKLVQIEKKLTEYDIDINSFKKILPETHERILDEEEIKDLLVKNGINTINENCTSLIIDYILTTNIIAHKKIKADESKQKLLIVLGNRVKQNELTNGKDHVRYIEEKRLNDTNVISIFDSSLSRIIGINEDELTDELIIVQIYYFDVFKDIMFYGFTFKGEKYRYLTSSAGQIRKKKAVFIKESTWYQIEKTLMCGLTTDVINKKGGNNVNKHLDYLALSNSATDEWLEFDIDKTIVIDDFETNVYGAFDFIDETDYTITRKSDYIPITHTDGAGMVLPSVSDRNFMFRAPWVKGLLGVFDFRKYIIEKDCSPIIYDIYGKEHNVLEEDIQIIFCKSQFKMYKYYTSWEEYKDYFKKYHCTTGRCNVEEDRVKNAKINYQMLQTLTDITDDEITLLSQKSAIKIENVCRSKDTMLDILGVTPSNNRMSAFQTALKIYPALLNDTYSKDVLREVKNSLLKKYRSGKLEINGKYMFLLPDYYAACEYWFSHIEVPTGLLENGEVYSKVFNQYDKLDCLRSPHLYKEHAVRYNVANDIERSKEISKWFVTGGLYTSTHDFISKLLQFDVDGDISLVVADKDFVQIAERNMQDIVPLYYNMRKAEPTELNNRNIYRGLNAAFTGGNIGFYSNEISKIWNNDVFVTGTDEEKQEAIDCIKYLCCQGNFVIDYAKTLYKPEFPDHIKAKISKYTTEKLPSFFEYAKDKDKSQVEERNNSFVNKIYEKIKDKPINTRGLSLEKINYTLLMSDPTLQCDKNVSELYDKLNKQYRFMINMKDEYIDNLRYVACKLRDEFSQFGYSEKVIADMLVEYTYGHGKRYKQVLWFCYGKYIVDNLRKNMNSVQMKEVKCIDCGELFEVNVRSKSCRCVYCTIKNNKLLQARWYQNKMLDIS